MSAAPVIIIITKPPKKNQAAKLTPESTEIHLIGHENSTDYEILMAAAAQLENAEK